MSNKELNEILEMNRENEKTVRNNLFPRTVDRFGVNRENIACTTNHGCTVGQRPDDEENVHQRFKI